jgi:hypothetical protein
VSRHQTIRRAAKTPPEGTIEIRRVKLTELSSEDRASINEVLIKSPNATVFHTVEWNQLLAHELGLQNVTLLATMGERPVGLYTFYPLREHRCLSPAVHSFSVYGGPIATSGSPEVVAALLRESERLHRFAVFQIWTPPNYDISPFARLGYSHSQMYAPFVDLQATEEELWAKLHRKKRGAIRKAIKSGVLVVDGDTSSLDEYYEMAVGTLGGAQIEALPKGFYRQVLERLAPKGMARLLLARYNGKMIAGGIWLFYEDTAYDWDMGWRRDTQDIPANDVLVWEVIKWASKHGYRCCDLLGLDPDHLPGIARWKMRFGADMIPRHYLQKKTPGNKLYRGLRLLANPGRAIRRIRRFMAGKHDAD